jgi:hypothetical protein
MKAWRSQLFTKLDSDVQDRYSGSTVLFLAYYASNVLSLSSVLHSPPRTNMAQPQLAATESTID